MNNLLLCGFMGCGKTTVGKRLSKTLSMEYIDLDAEIESEAGLPIPELFRLYGEPYFRDLEHEALSKLSHRISCVVSTGGGAMTFQRNRMAVSPEDLVIFLDASFPVCYQRIQGSDRPLLRTNTLEEFQALYENRRAAYEQAASLVVNADASPQQVEAAVLEALQAAGFPHK